jgi:hypothetical protein
MEESQGDLIKRRMREKVRMRGCENDETESKDENI